MRLTLILAPLLALAVGCPETKRECYPGHERVDGVCTPIDRPDSGPGEAGVDASTDAGTDGARPDGTTADGSTCAPECSDGTVCNPATGECVECIDDAQCAPIAATPHCDTGTNTCVACTENDHCSGAEQTLCDDDSTHGERYRTCVECITNADCTDPNAPRCNEGECAPCTVDDDCNGITEDGTTLSICTEVGGANQCVECTPATEATDCDPSHACNPVTYRCSEFVTGSRDICESCDTDSNCSDSDAGCVPLTYQGVARGGYCLKRRAPTCEQPYSITLTGRTTLSGASGSAYCGINEALATCEAVHALVNNVECTDEGCEEGACDCPGRGLCRQVGGLPDRCTYRCSGPSQCDETPNPGSTCGDGGNPDAGTETYCGG